MDDIRLLTIIVLRVCGDNEYARVHHMVEVTGWTESKTRRVLQRLMYGGLVVRSGRGMYAPDFRHDLARAYASVHQVVMDMHYD